MDSFIDLIQKSKEPFSETAFTFFPITKLNLVLSTYGVTTSSGPQFGLVEWAAIQCVRIQAPLGA